MRLGEPTVVQQEVGNAFGVLSFVELALRELCQALARQAIPAQTEIEVPGAAALVRQPATRREVAHPRLLQAVHDRHDRQADQRIGTERALVKALGLLDHRLPVFRHAVTDFLISERGPPGVREKTQGEVGIRKARVELDREPQQAIRLPPILMLPMREREVIQALRVVRVLAHPRLHFLDAPIQEREFLSVRVGRGAAQRKQYERHTVHHGLR